MGNAQRYGIQEIGCDPWYAEVHCNQQLHDEDGHSVVEVRQTKTAMGPPTAEFEKLLRAGRIPRGNHPLLS